MNRTGSGSGAGTGTGSDREPASSRSRFGLRVVGLLLDLLMLVVALLLSPWLLYMVFVEGRSCGSILERFGCWSLSIPVRERIWIHAASVGEVRAAAPLIDALRRNRPGAEFVVSTMTTGARDLARSSIADVQVRLFPFDFSVFMHPLLFQLRPDLLVLVELELWPNLLVACRSRSIPVVVVNGRISRSGAKKLSLVEPLTRWLLQVPEQVCARGEQDAERFLALGTSAEKIRITGELKHDALEGPSPLSRREQHDHSLGFGQNDFRWVAGCTHPGEEELILKAHRSLLEVKPSSQLLLAPRHVERADSLLQLSRRLGFEAVLQSTSVGDCSSVVVIDRIGELEGAYRISDAAFVGGSFVPHGGHNLLEPVAAGCATCHGPFIDNFTDLARILEDADAIEGLASADQLGPLLDRWARDPELRQRSRQKGMLITAQLGGAADRCAEHLDQILNYR
ncbi:MAG: glycosyltransferase N-terminal domain-containing protein [Planctomycetota bacterium]|nr:glycosyltransferase N-terminal domain-containing protein [Planctomycetota bacterium]